MSELELLEQLLIRIRREKLEAAHVATLAASGAQDFVHISNRAHEAELAQRALNAIKVLKRDPGQFIKEFLP